MHANRKLNEMKTQQLNIDARLQLLNIKFDSLHAVMRDLKDEIAPRLVEITEREDVPADVRILLLQQIILMEKF